MDLKRVVMAAGRDLSPGIKVGTASLVLLLSMAIVLVTSAAAVAPTVSVDAPTDVSYTSVHVSGTVDPEDHETTYYFQYSSDPANLGWSFGAIQGPLAAGAGSTAVADDLAGLKPGTTYFFRLVASNESGETSSPEPYPSFETAAVPPPQVSVSPVSEITGTTAKFSGEINPEAPAGNPAAFDVTWRFQCTPSCQGLDGAIPADSADHPVEVQATGLQPNTAYEVSLEAENAGGAATAGPVSFTTPAIAPEVVSSGALAAYSEATLSAQINPWNSASSYRFEYGATSAYGQSTPEAAIAAGNKPVSVSTGIAGLQPGSTYHFRVVTSNSAGSTAGPDRVFTAGVPIDPAADTCGNAAIRRQQRSFFLPDCRAYEKVSPDGKNSTSVGFTSSRSRSSLDGNSATFNSMSAFADPKASLPTNQYLAQRTPDGWRSVSLAPPQDPNPLNLLRRVNFRNFSEDLRTAVVDAPPPVLAPGATAGTNNIYWQDTAAQTFRTVTTAAPNGADLFYQPFYAAASADLDHVVFESIGALTADAPDNGLMKVYESVDGDLRLAGVLPDGTPAASSVVAYGANRFGFQYGERRTARAISEEGETIFFTVPELEDPFGVGYSGQIYARIGGSSTVHASASRRSSPDPAGTQPATFRSAAADGSSVTFTTSEQLIDEDEDAAVDLYRYVVGGDALELLSVDGEPADGDESDVLGVVASSDDGERVFFVDSGQLKAGAPTPGGPYLYLSEGGSLHYVTQLSPDDEVSETVATLWSPKARVHGARISADGSLLLFTSAAPQPGYPASGFRQIYLYDAEADSISCPSCPPGGGPAGSHAVFTQSQNGVGSEFVNYESRALSSDGKRVFFATETPLLAADVNGKKDVYRYDVEADKVALVSSGTSADDSYFLDASADGNDVFFTTRERLVGVDTDDHLDVYDARIGGGFPEPAPPPPACEGDECQGAPSATGALPAIGSVNPSAGNRKPRRCVRAKKGSRKSVARCGRKKQRHTQKKRSGKNGKQSKATGGKR